MKKYLCGVTFQHELGYTSIRLYDTVEECKKGNKCWQQCGIVEIEIEDEDDPEFYTAHKWIEEQNFELGNVKPDLKDKTRSDP